jgi:hypothetical protein
LSADRSHPQISVDQKTQKNDDRNEGLSKGESSFLPVVNDRIECGIDQEDEKGRAIDPCQVCHLDKRKVEILRIAQVRPGKSREKERAEVFQSHPEDRGEENRLES